MIYGAEVVHFCAANENSRGCREQRDALSGVAYDAPRAGCDGLERRKSAARCAGRLMLTSRAKRLMACVYKHVHAFSEKPWRSRAAGAVGHDTESGGRVRARGLRQRAACQRYVPCAQQRCSLQ
ncbi:hypothetical protein OAO87_02700 [bacterium]|nr:hypothetical protein [bacterium]